LVREIFGTNSGRADIEGRTVWLMEEAPAATIAAVQDFLAAH